MTMTKANPEREERRRKQKEIADRLKSSGALDEIFAKIDAGEALTGEQGLIGGMLKAALERGLDAELTEHVGYDRGDAEASLHDNSRNGTSAKTVGTEVGDLELAIPRDRNGSFTPMLVPKGQRRLDGLDGMIISLYAGGMTLRDIQHHLASTIGTDLSHETISKITDAVQEEVLAWQHRPLESLYPVVYLDAIIVKIRDGGHVRNKAAHGHMRDRHGLLVIGQQVGRSATNGPEHPVQGGEHARRGLIPQRDHYPEPRPCQPGHQQDRLDPVDDRSVTEVVLDPHSRLGDPGPVHPGPAQPVSRPSLGHRTAGGAL